MAVVSLFWLLRQKPIYQSGTTASFLRKIRYVIEPGTGRYVESDPIGLEGGINTYGYAYQNSINTVDPYGLKGWYCQRSLDEEPGERGPPVLNHQYLCVTKPNGTIECGSQTTDGNLFRNEGRPTRPDEDYYHEGSCEQVDDDENQCYEKCVRYNFTKPRPPYGIGPQGTDCQEWSSNTNIGCKLICAKYPDRAEEYFSLRL